MDDIIIQLHTLLATNKSLERLIIRILKNRNIAPSWKNKSIKDFLNFFEKWLYALINPNNPGFYFEKFYDLVTIKLGQKLLKNIFFMIWLVNFLNKRCAFLKSPASAKNMKLLVTFIPKHKEGMNMQMIPTTSDGGFGRKINGDQYQKNIIKKYKLYQKLIVKDKTFTYNLNKNIMTKIFNFYSFRDFFLRRYLPGTRPLGKKPKEWNNKVTFKKKNSIVSPADGTIQWLFKNVDLNHTFQVKNELFSIKYDLIYNHKFLTKFIGGSMLNILLWMTDYHHFHSPISGKVVEINDFNISNFADLGKKVFEYAGPAPPIGKDIKWQKQLVKTYGNKINVNYNWFKNLSRHRRSVYIFNTNITNGSHIGLVIMMAIGYYGVGSINTIIKTGDIVKRGQLIGNFDCGGSSIVLLFERNKVNIGIPNIIPKFSTTHPQESSKWLPINVRETIAIKK